MNFFLKVHEIMKNESFNIMNSFGKSFDLKKNDIMNSFGKSFDFMENVSFDLLNFDLVTFFLTYRSRKTGLKCRKINYGLDYNAAISDLNVDLCGSQQQGQLNVSG